MARKKPNVFLSLALAGGAGLLAFMFLGKKGVTDGVVTISPENLFNMSIGRAKPGDVLVNPITGEKITITKDILRQHAEKATRGRG